MGQVRGSPDTHNGTGHIPALPHQHSDPEGIHPRTVPLSCIAYIAGRPVHEIHSPSRYGIEDGIFDKQPSLLEASVHPVPEDLPTHNSNRLGMTHFSADSVPAM